jgi:hypothetical protein
VKMATPVDADFEEDWPSTVADPVRDSIGNLLVTIIENTVAGSRERKLAMNEALQAHERIKLAMCVRPKRRSWPFRACRRRFDRGNRMGAVIVGGTPRRLRSSATMVQPFPGHVIRRTRIRIRASMVV